MATDPDNGIVKFSVKELLMELRRDVAAIDAKLELKADRERVHGVVNDLAAIRLERAAETAIREQVMGEFRAAQRQIESLKAWRNKLIGAAGLAVFLGAATASRVFFGIG